ncbi:GMC family oxidoreductase [Protofrankia sp. BMG5.30]|uniref:GMC family oxidoreductase n=2 Tax=Protofrankia TaxID=2994361 RepID=UPI0009779211|nr:FAD-dependent oxidoreductase [Protofrankia sp. BMG5.30]ONH34398.1 FAD-dependent oxidoreductase [Protofrankia sp. BMG5.30]
MGRSEHADVVVVGSGFGGAVTAYRFAEAGHSVVLLERGKAYPPGSFARSPTEIAANFWDPSQGRHGLFDVWSFADFEAVVSSGLGGGSLIYANVMLRKDEKWFVRDAPAGEGYESWPISRADLEPHYAAVEKTIGVQRFPKGQPRYQVSRRTEVLEQAGERLGYTAEQPPLAVTFGVGGDAPVPGAPIGEPAYGNIHGRPRITCVLCGECDLGCNYGSKNTLDHTYLSAAVHHGADLRVHHEARSITPGDGGGYTVGYVVHTPGDVVATSALPQRTITCDRLVLAAGTLGTTYLLLRNRAALPGISRMLGRRFSGNGDLLGFVSGVPGPALGSAHAPVITTAVRVPDAVDSHGGHAGGRGGPGAERGCYIEDAGYPGFAEWLVEAANLDNEASRIVRTVYELIRSRLTGGPSRQIGALVGRLLGPGEASAGAMPLLGMGRDIPTGKISVRDDYLQIENYPADSQPYFERLDRLMEDLAEEMGGKYHRNPLTLLSRVITVHPLGGASMGTDIATGVIDEWGEVFNHPGLYVADGAALPGPVGANPSLTIAAFADRLAEHAVDAGPVLETQP